MNNQIYIIKDAITSQENSGRREDQDYQPKIRNMNFMLYRFDRNRQIAGKGYIEKSLSLSLFCEQFKANILSQDASQLNLSLIQLNAYFSPFETCVHWQAVATRCRGAS